MAVIPVQKVRIYAPKSEASLLAEELQKFGAVELVAETTEETTSATVTDHANSHHYAQVEMARHFLSQYHSVGALLNIFEGGRAHTSKAELDALANSNTVSETITSVEAFQLRLADLERTKRQLEQELRTVQMFERLEIPLSEIGETATTSTIAVRGAERLIAAAVEDTNTAIGTEVAITLISSTAALFTSLKSSHTKLEELITTHGLEIVSLPNTPNTVSIEIERINNALEAILSAHASLQQEISAVAVSELTTLQKICDIARWQAERSDVAQSVASTERIAVVTAWIPVKKTATLEAILSEKIPASAIEVINHGDEIPPTQISNDGVVGPFESVTELYGMPDYRDLDPTPFLAVFFFVFFGLCLSDAGYGLILMVLTGLVLYKYHLDKATKQLMTLLFFGGLGTLIAGILFGGYFGLSPEQIHPALVPLQKFNPISNPLPVFYLSLVLGFIQVSFGIFLNIIRQMKLGEKKDAILDNSPWLFLFLLIAVVLLNQTGFLNEALGSFLSAQQTNLFYFAAALLVVTQGRQQKNIIMKFLHGLLGLYGGVNYFADVLSYSRIMALGLATGALAFSINSIASFVGGESLGISTVFMILVLIFGHTLNIAISLLGTFINSARLQFVEFFSKFSTGTGRPFVPFRKEPRHVIILSDPPSSP